LGRRYAEACGMTILSDPTRVILYGKPVLLMHGDLLCTDDVKYQQFRRQIRKPWLQKLILSLPLWFRLYLAKLGRQKSRDHIKQVNRQIQDVVQGTVEEYMRKWECDLLIHGHTHVPAIYEFPLNHRLAHRIVLSAWHTEGFALCYSADGQYKSVKI
jgi:UDP-2,3-diacylglucosamine hydrolase